MRVIDLRSDTITQPTEAMRRAMYEAEVGDDGYGEDPTVRRLEALAAQLMGKEAGLFTASGTMSNLIAMLAHTQRGDEVIMGDRSHIFHSEVGGGAVLGGLVYRILPNDERGRLHPQDVAEAIRGQNIDYPRTGLVCLENTHNRCGGGVLTPQDTRAVADVAHAHGVPVHLDGARIFNAAVALEVPATALTADVDSVCFCLSKGLAAPVGSLLCGSRDFIERAAKYRKMVGGGMRQVGVLAAAGLVALETGIPRLAEDHATARRLAEQLAAIPGVRLDLDGVQTNIVTIQVPGAPAAEVARRIEEEGVRCKLQGSRIRFVTHYMVAMADMDEAARRIAAALRGAVGAQA